MRRHFGNDLNPADFGPAKASNPGGGFANPTTLPGGIPNTARGVMDLMKDIRAKAKQALPAAPSTLPPVPSGFKLGVVGWGLVGLAGYLVLFRKKGKVHG